ncbi:MAG TPA: hypothetical protein VF053_21450 [Streptosporangiales bacterium]
MLPRAPSADALARRRVVIVSASVGAGHDGAADELASRLLRRGFAVDQHDFIELLPASIGRRARRVYAAQLRAVPSTWSWLMGAMASRAVASTFTSLCTAVAGESMRQAIAAPPAVVVSTHHIASQIIGRLRLSGRLCSPAVTFLTDMSVHRMWVSPGIDAHLAIGPTAMEQARALDARSVYACAPAVPPTFRPARSAAERAWARKRLGLPLGQPIALVVAGSWGVGEVEQTAADVMSTGLALPVVACGRNDALRQRIHRAGTGLALGWVDDMPDLLRASDVVVQNAGGLTSLESLATAVPMITYRPIPGHGLANAAALQDAGLAPWVRDRADLAAALRHAMSAGSRSLTWPAADPAALVEAIALGRATTPETVAAIYAGRHGTDRPATLPVAAEVPA